MFNRMRETDKTNLWALSYEVAPLKDNHTAIHCVLWVGRVDCKSGRWEAVCIFSPLYLIIIKELCMVILNGCVNHSTFRSAQLHINLSVQV